MFNTSSYNVHADRSTKDLFASPMSNYKWLCHIETAISRFKTAMFTFAQEKLFFTQAYKVISLVRLVINIITAYLFLKLLHLISSFFSLVITAFALPLFRAVHQMLYGTFQIFYLVEMKQSIPYRKSSTKALFSKEKKLN